MAGTGPPPNPNSRKSTSGAVRWTNLPAEGYGGIVPAWPFLAATERERAVWETIWRTPQAAAWIRLGWLLEVAIYVRVLRFAEEGDMKAITEARLRSVELGLTPTGMLKNHWRIVDDEVSTKREDKAGASAPRRRLKVAATDAVAEG